MSNGVYDLYIPPNSPSKAGKARAAVAKRDKWSRFLPNDNKALPVPECHGRAGGIKRAKIGKRDKRGRYIK